MKLVRYIFGFYFCTILPLSTFAAVHYDHSFDEQHAPHICIEQSADCDCKTTPHEEESIWEHIFEKGCLKDISIQIFTPVLSVIFVDPDFKFEPQFIAYRLNDAPKTLPAPFILLSAPGRAPPLTHSL